MKNNQLQLVRQLFDSQIIASQLGIWKDEFGAREVFRRISKKISNISSPLTAEKVGWYLFWFCSMLKRLSIGGPVVCSASAEELRDLEIKCLSNAKTADGVKYCGFVVAFVVKYVAGSLKMFSTATSTSAIINALSKYATTSHSVQYLCKAIAAIADSSAGLFSTLDVVSAIINALNNYATTPESVQALGGAIVNITANNPEGQRLFSTPSAVSAIVNALNNHAAVPDSVCVICFAINNIAFNNAEGQRLFSNPEAVSAIIKALTDYASTPESVQALCNVIVCVTANNPEGFSTLDAASAIVKTLGKYAANVASVQYLAHAIGNIAFSISEPIFSETELVKVILGCLKQHAKKPRSVSNLIALVANLVRHDAKRILLDKSDLVESLQTIMENATEALGFSATIFIVSSLRDALDPSLAESIMCLVPVAATRFFGNSELIIDDNVAKCVVLLLNLGEQCADPVCSRQMLIKLGHFDYFQRKMSIRGEYPNKIHVQNAIREIYSRLVWRFGKWLYILMKKYSTNNNQLMDDNQSSQTDIAYEEIDPKIPIVALFEQELDETNFLCQSTDFFESLETVLDETKKLLIGLRDAEVQSIQQSMAARSDASDDLQLEAEFVAKLILPQDITYGRILGQGSYGCVKLGSIVSQHKRHTHVAAKSFNDCLHGIQEAKNYLQLDHPNITKFVGVTSNNNKNNNNNNVDDNISASIVLLLELADFTLLELINPCSAPLRVHEIKNIAVQMASALQYLHNKNLRHLDLKPENVLIFQQQRGSFVKLADFGSMLETEETFAAKAFVAGTIPYLPPEHHAATERRAGIPVSPMFDIFAFGVILMEMLVWTKDARSKGFAEILAVKDDILRGKIVLLDSEKCCIKDDDWRKDIVDDKYGKELIEICKKCLMVDPSNRFADGAALIGKLMGLPEDEEEKKKAQEFRLLLKAFPTMSTGFESEPASSSQKSQHLSMRSTVQSGNQVESSLKESVLHKSQSSVKGNNNNDQNSTMQSIPNSSVRFGDWIVDKSKVLREGAFGKIYRVSKSGSNKLFAVKEITNLKNYSHQHREFQPSGNISSPHVIQCEETLRTDGEALGTFKYFIIMELVADGHNLEELAQNGVFVEPKARNIFRQVVLGLLALHQNGIVHRDMKLRNVLYDAKADRAVICDLGFTKNYLPGTKNLNSNTLCGTDGWRAPEVGRKDYALEPVDVFSLGVMLHKMLTGRMPPPHDARTDDWMPNTSSEPANGIISRMLACDPDSRVTLRGILKHAYFFGDDSPERLLSLFGGNESNHPPEVVAELERAWSGPEKKDSAVEKLAAYHGELDGIIAGLKLKPESEIVLRFLGTAVRCRNILFGAENVIENKYIHGKMKMTKYDRDASNDFRQTQTVDGATYCSLIGFDRPMTVRRQLQGVFQDFKIEVRKTATDHLCAEIKINNATVGDFDEFVKFIEYLIVRFKGL